MMCDIKLSSIISEHKTLPNAGSVLYNKISDAISTGNKLKIDMEGVTALPSIFLNVSFGKIIDESGKEALKNHVIFMNITKLQAEKLTEYLKRYK